MPAPYSDDLYSDPDPMRDEAHAGQSHDQDLAASEADALSPTDGYFQSSSAPDDSPLFGISHQRRQSSNVPHVPNVMVEDPSLQQRQDGPSDKAQEAARERLINSPADASSEATVGDNRASSTSSPFPSVTYYSQNPLRSPAAASPTISHPSAPSPGHRRSVDEDHVTYYSQQSSASSPSPYNTSGRAAPSESSDAPPAYSPTSPTSTGYQTFPSNNPSEADDMGAPDEHQALLPSQPQSMGGQPQGGPPPPVWQRIKEAPRSSTFRKYVKRTLVVLLLLSIFSAIFGGVSISWKAPKRPPVNDTHPAKPPAMDDGKLTWKPWSGCLNKPQSTYYRSLYPSFELGKALTIVQSIKDVSGGSYSPDVSGNVIIRPTGDENARIDVEVITNHEDLGFDIDYTSGNDQQLRIETPARVAWSNLLSPCVQMRITLYVPAKAKGHKLDIDTKQLDIDVADGLSLEMESSTTLLTVSGHVILPDKDPKSSKGPYTLSSREVIIHTVSGHVKGWLPLYDLLQVKTVSGSVGVDVGPQAADQRFKAELDIETKSGTIRVAEKVKGKSPSYRSELPDRDYDVLIHSISGTIHADVVFGSSARIFSSSANMNLHLLPLTAATLEEWSPSLSTESISGTLRLNVAEPIKSKSAGRSDGSSMTKFTSRHKATSASMEMVYPGSWEGTLEGKSMSGSWNVHGRGVEVYKKETFVGKTIEASKGDGSSTIKIEEVSGKVDCLIGKD